MYEIALVQEQHDEVIAELLGVINKMTHSNKRLEGIIRSYKEMATSYDTKAKALLDERDRARALAVMLEQECNECWGPIHSQTIEAAKLAMILWGEPDGA